jgi:hypothetical protein
MAPGRQMCCAESQVELAVKADGNRKRRYLSGPDQPRRSSYPYSISSWGSGYFPAHSGDRTSHSLKRAAPVFLLPVAHVTCEVLPFGPHGFASRKANRITYASQGETKLGRLVSAKLKLYEKLWPMEESRHAVRGRHRESLWDRYWDLEFAIDQVMDAG